MEELTTKTDGLKENVQSSLEILEKNKNVLSIMEKGLEEAGQTIHEVELALNNSRNNQEQHNKEVERLEQKLSLLKKERSDGQQELSILNLRKESLFTEIAKENSEKIQQEDTLNLLRQELDLQRVLLEEKSGEIGVIKVRIASLKGKRENTLTEINRLDLQQENHLHQIRKRENDTTESKQKIDSTQQAIELIEKEILENLREKDLLEEEAINDEESLREKEASVKEMEKESKDLSRQIQELIEAIAKTELKRSENFIFCFL